MEGKRGRGRVVGELGMGRKRDRGRMVDEEGVLEGLDAMHATVSKARLKAQH